MQDDELLSEQDESGCYACHCGSKRRNDMHDRIYLINNRFDLFEFEIHGAEEMHALLADGRGLFLFGSHLGSFEVLRALGKLHPELQVAMVMHEANAKKINSILSAINPEAKHDIIGMGNVDSMLMVNERLEQGYLVALLADRTPAQEALLPDTGVPR